MSEDEDEQEGEEEEIKEDDPETQPGREGWSAVHHWPVLDVLKNHAAENMTNAAAGHENGGIRVVPQISADMSWAKEFTGAFFYDNLKVRGPPESAQEDFAEFYKSKEADALGVCRNKVQAGVASFTQSFVTKDWTSPDECWLRCCFWGCRQIESDFEGVTAGVDKALLPALSRLGALKHQAAKIKHSQVGFAAALGKHFSARPSHVGFIIHPYVASGVATLMMRRVIACSEGARFVTGLPADTLLDLMVKDKQPGSYFGMCAYVVNLAPEKLREAGGFTCTVSAMQAVEIPPGFIVAECSLSMSNTIQHWTTFRPEDVQGERLNRLQKQCEIVFKMLRADQKGEQPCEVKNSVLERTLLQLEVAPAVIGWCKDKAEAGAGSRETPPLTPTGLCAVSLDQHKSLYMSDVTFSFAAMLSD